MSQVWILSFGLKFEGLWLKATLVREQCLAYAYSLRRGHGEYAFC
jgi:hypothetical protein